MIAGRRIVLVAGCSLRPEARVEIEALGALIIDICHRDPALLLRYMRHALLDLTPEPHRKRWMPRSRGTR